MMGNNFCPRALAQELFPVLSIDSAVGPLSLASRVTFRLPYHSSAGWRCDSQRGLRGRRQSGFNAYVTLAG